MQLLELALQGIKGFPAQVRITLPQGHVVLWAPATAQLQPVLATLLYSEGVPGPETQRLEAPGAAAVRASLTFRSRDGFTYRLVRDLRGGAVLHRLDGAENKFVPFSQDPAEIAHHLRQHAGLPSRRVYEDVFTAGEGRLPTTRAAAAPAPGGPEAEIEGKPLSKVAQRLAEKAALKAGIAPTAAAERPVTPGPRAAFRGYAGPDPGAAMTPVPVGLDRATVQASLTRLQQELQQVRTLEHVQFELDGLQAQLGNAEEKLKEEERVLGEIAEAEKELAEKRKLPIPINLRMRLEACAEAEVRKKDTLARIEAEREELLARVEGANPVPFVSDRRFWAGVGGGTLALAVGIFTGARAFALLNIPAMGFSAVLALRYVGELQAKSGLQRKHALLDERDRKANDEYDAATSDIRKSMALLECDTTAELEARAAERDTAAEKVQQLQQRLAKLRSDPAFQEAFRERDRLIVEMTGLEERLGGKRDEAYVRSSSEIEREIDRYKSMLFVSSDRTVAPPAPEAEPAKTPFREDASARLLERAAELFGVERAELPRILQERVGQYLVALSEKKWSAVEIGAAAGMVCVGAPGRRAFYELPGRDADVAQLSLQLTIIERYAGRFKVPVILDDPFAFLGPAQQAMAAKMLKVLGQRTQVLHRTTTRALSDGADAVVEIK
jgi:hypothetical protein